jgi:hypothetical protein
MKNIGFVIYIVEVYITVLSALTNSKLVIPCCIDLEWTNDLTKKKSEYLCYQRYIKLELKTNKLNVYFLGGIQENNLSEFKIMRFNYINYKSYVFH